jgi:hypothetical protein
MAKPKRMINQNTERVPFEEIVDSTFEKFKDNIVISQDNKKSITKEMIKKIREQLKGASTKK